jgi:hypothetical protein
MYFFRPLLTAIVEYILVYVVLKHGKEHKRIIASVLFFLASYQLGEFLVFMSNGEQLAFKVAYISTTLLPPLGVLLVSRVLKRQLGYFFFQSLSIIFVIFMLLTPQIILSFDFVRCCIQVNEYHPLLGQYWMQFYQGTLMFTMLAAFLGYVFTTSKKIKNQLKWILFGYFAFDGVAMILYFANPGVRSSIASLMCALAIFAAFIFAKVALGNNLQLSEQLKRLSNMVPKL